ncbi:hypothetical protein E2562_033401 [Oryza meyeriana var. granulata]|uniref:Uncharacterized protein n=1 Tax=Oryza meyeriana var. granulata TaxID=110450 RepID=A0A6G1C1I5_9ORYZ|nr:hypothetical protein E2562_033401 [Oryza meyeriana var. granulata]
MLENPSEWPERISMVGPRHSGVVVMAVTGADTASESVSYAANPCNTSYRTCVGRGSLLATAFASASVSAISEWGMLGTEMPLKWALAFWNAERYLASSGWRA